MKRLAFLLVAACAKNPPVVSAVSVTPVATASATIASATTNPGSLCRTFSEDMKRAMDRVLVGGTKDSPIGFCADTRNGAWQIEMPASFDDANNDEAIRIVLETQWRIAHVGRDGTRVSWAPPDSQRLTGYGVRVVKTPMMFDFDGDGEPELYVEENEDGDEGHQQIESLLVTFRRGAIEPYTTIPFHSMEDVDNDGRPDLKMLAGYDDSLEGCFSGFPYDHPSPLFVAHALANGAFSTNDAAAKAFVKNWCPAEPTSIRSSADALCSRLWTKDLKAARTRVDKSCAGGWCDREVAQKPQPKDATEDCERRIAWFDRTPPLTLP